MIAEMQETFPGLYIIKVHLKKSLNDYQQKCKQPKLLLRASFLHTKISTFLFLSNSTSSPGLFSQKRGRAPGTRLYFWQLFLNQFIYIPQPKRLLTTLTLCVLELLGLHPQRFTSPSGNICKRWCLHPDAFYAYPSFAFTRTRVGSECFIVTQLATPVPYFPLVYPHICLQFLLFVVPSLVSSLSYFPGECTVWHDILRR